MATRNKKRQNITFKGLKDFETNIEYSHSLKESSCQNFTKSRKYSSELGLLIDEVEENTDFSEFI